MSRQNFSKAYKEYGLHYSKKNYKECLNVMSVIQLEGNYFLLHEAVQFLLRSSCYALSQITNPSDEFKVVVLNSFKAVLSEIAEGNDYEKFFAILNWFTSPKYLERYLPIFVSLPTTSECDLKSWLQHVRTYLLRLLGSIDSSDRKEIYLHITRTLLMFVNAEAQLAVQSKGRWKFQESSNFLKSCQQLDLFKEGVDVKQYQSCFKLLNDFIVALSAKAETGQLAASMHQFETQFRSLTKLNEVRATLTKDNFFTLSKIIKICESRFLATVNDETASSFFNLLSYIGHGSSQMKSENPFCANCENIGQHCCHDMSMLMANMYSKLIENGISSEVIEKFATTITTQFEVISKVSCAKASVLQDEATIIFKSIVKKCKTKKQADFVIPFLKSMLKRYHKINLISTKYLNEISILNYLFNALNIAEKWDELLDVGYLLMAFLVSSAETPNNFDQTAWAVAKKQKENIGQIKIKTPFDHFNKMKKDPTYGLNLPDNFDLGKMALAFLRVGFKYAIMAPEVSNKIIHQILMKASTKDPQALRFVLSVQSMNFDRVTSERVEQLTKALLPKCKGNLSIGLQIAAIKYLKFSHDNAVLTEKYKELSINNAFSEADLTSDTSIFRQITLDNEKIQMETLQFVKEKFISFGKFYLDLKNDEHRKPFEEEKEFLLRELKVVANQFIVRGYLDDGLDLYMSLFNLAKAVNDDFGLIDSCSCFAENAAEFKQKFPQINHSEIIKACFGVAIKKLKELDKVSARKQTQVCFCLLNLVLFYYENGGGNQNEINHILRYMFKTIGGIGDAELEGSTQSTIGHLKLKEGTVDTITKIHSEPVRIKFYAILFTIITKYGAKSCFHPSRYIHFVMQHIKKYMNVYYDSSAALPILMYNLIPEMITWLLSIYEFNDDSVSLLCAMLKLALRSGYVFRGISLTIDLLNIDVATEKLEKCQIRLKALENMILADHSGEYEYMEKPAFAADDNGKLCEPIRRQAQISPIKCLSPRQVTTGGVSNPIVKYLPTHRSECKCGVCFNPQNRFQMFCVAVFYARYVYISKEFDVDVKRLVFTKLYEFWEENRSDLNKFPRSALFYITSARMLSFYSHFQIKFEKNYALAKELLCRALKGLEKVKHGAELMKHDLKFQCDDLETKIKRKDMTKEEILANVNILNHKKNFDSKRSTDNLQIKKPAKPPVKVTVKPRLNLMDMISDQTNPSNFQIHGDDDQEAEPITPSVKKSSRGRPKINEETPIRTPSAQINFPGSSRSVAKTVERPKRLPKTIKPTVMDLTSPPDDNKIEAEENASKPRMAMPRTSRRPNHLIPALKVDLTSPPETNNGKMAAAATATNEISPETPIGKSFEENEPKQNAPKKPKCPAPRATRKATAQSNESYQS